MKLSALMPAVRDLKDSSSSCNRLWDGCALLPSRWSGLLVVRSDMVSERALVSVFSGCAHGLVLEDAECMAAVRASAR